jgi:ribosomal protein S4
MRRINTFKARLKNKSFLLDCPKKILNFRRPKWVLYVNDIKKDIKRKFFLSTQMSTSNFNLKKDQESPIWDKKKLFYKKKLNLRQNFLHSYDNGFKKVFIKKAALGNNFKADNFILFKNIVVKLEYNLAFLLFRLNFFSSIFESRKAISKEDVFVNSSKVSHNYFVKKGDIISFSNEKIIFKDILLKKFKKQILIPFIEVDYYSNRLVIIKDFKDISFEDVTLFYCKHTNISNYLISFNRS